MKKATNTPSAHTWSNTTNDPKEVIQDTWSNNTWVVADSVE